MAISGTLPIETLGAVAASALPRGTHAVCDESEPNCQKAIKVHAEKGTLQSEVGFGVALLRRMHTKLDMCSRVPLGSKFFRYYDLSDAFHTCRVTDETRKLLVVQFNDEYYQYTGGAQGIANMAVH